MIDGRGKQVEKTDSAYTRYRHIVKTGESEFDNYFAFSQSFHMRFVDNGQFFFLSFDDFPTDAFRQIKLQALIRYIFGDSRETDTS